MTDTGCTNGHGTEIITGPNLIAAGLRIDCFRLSLCFFCCCPALRFLYGRRGNQRCTFLGAISLKYELAGLISGNDTIPRLDLINRIGRCLTDFRSFQPLLQRHHAGSICLYGTCSHGIPPHNFSILA